MGKLIRNGKVAVTLSCGVRTRVGWSTWNEKISPFDIDIATAVLNRDFGLVLRLAEERTDRYPNLTAYDDLRIVWVEIGKRFIIKSELGYETIQYEEDIAWLEA